MPRLILSRVIPFGPSPALIPYRSGLCTEWSRHSFFTGHILQICCALVVVFMSPGLGKNKTVCPLHAACSAQSPTGVNLNSLNMFHLNFSCAEFLRVDW